MREGKKEQCLNPNHTMRQRCACVYFYRNANTCPDFSDSISPVFSKSSWSLSFTVFGEWARLSSVGSVWHLQGSLEENEVHCQRRTRLLDCSIDGAFLSR